MKRVKSILSVLIIGIMLAGCGTHYHTVGSGASGNSTEEARQWYVLFGLVPINEVDSKQMAGNASDYTIKTQQSFLDVVINIFTGVVTIHSRTVTVTK